MKLMNWLNVFIGGVIYNIFIEHCIWATVLCLVGVFVFIRFNKIKCECKVKGLRKK